MTSGTTQAPLQDKVAIVTGGGGGIGSATVNRLAGSGAAVAVFDISQESAERAAEAALTTTPQARVLPVACDITDPQAVEDAVGKVVAEFGGVHVLVNNAGVTRDNLLFKMSVEDWDTVLGIHLRGAFLMSKAVQATMVEQRWGRIVNLSSINALGAKGQANYSAAKMGMRGFTGTLALELGPFGITVNAVAPGFIATPMTDATARRLKLEPAEYQQMVADQTPVRRVGHPSDIAATIGFLVSEEASFITGQTITVDGGMRLAG